MYIICHHDVFGECKGQYDEFRRFGGTFCNGLQNCWHNVQFYYTSRLASYSPHGGCLEKVSNEEVEYYYFSLGSCNLKSWELPK